MRTRRSGQGAGRVGGTRPHARHRSQPAARAGSGLPLSARRPFGAVRVFAHRPRAHHCGGDGPRRRHPGPGRAGSRANGAVGRPGAGARRPGVPRVLPHHRGAACCTLSPRPRRAAGAAGGRRRREPGPQHLWRRRRAERRLAGGGGGSGCRERDGARARRRSPPRCARCRWQQHRRAGQRPGRHLSERQPPALRGHGGSRPAADRVSARRASPCRQLSPTQPPDQRAGSSDGGGRGGPRLGRSWPYPGRSPAPSRPAPIA
jgi:hypothetical protein